MAEKPSYEALQGKIRELETDKVHLSTQHDALNSLFNLSPDMLCMADLDGYFRLINAAFESTLGYSRQVLLGKPFMEFVHPDDKAATTEAMMVLATGEPLPYFENRYRCHDGSYKWLAWTCGAVTGEGHLYAVARDITPQKELQDDLKRQNDLLRTILSNVPAAVFWKDRNSVFLGANEQVARDAGLQSPHECVGKTDYDFSWTREQSDFYRECDRQVMDSGKPMLNIVETQQQADGREVSLLTSKVPLLDAAGQVYGMLGIYMDITKRIEAETALAISEQRFRTIFNSSFQLIGMLDPDGILLDANQTALDAVGVKREDVIGMKFWDIDCWAYSAKVQDRLRAAISEVSKGKSVRYEEELLTRGDVIRTIDFTIKPVFNEQGETILMIPEGWDITDLKQAEEETLHHHQDLAQVVRLSTAGEMASGMAHELNQPLTALVSYCETAISLLKTKPAAPQQIVEILERASEQAHRAGDIIRHLREFVGKSSNSREPLSIDSIIPGIMGFLKYELQNSNVTIEFRPGCQACEVRVDKIQIEQVLINLVRNSLEAIRDSNISDGQVVIQSGLSANDMIEVTVTDNGPGINAEIADTLFDPFQTNKDSGMGIGLSLSHAIIDAHEGKLWVDKHRQAGALFGFQLPVSQ